MRFITPKNYTGYLISTVRWFHQNMWGRKSAGVNGANIYSNIYCSKVCPFFKWYKSCLIIYCKNDILLHRRFSLCAAVRLRMFHKWKYRISARLGCLRRYAAPKVAPQILLHKFEKIRPKKSMTWFLWPVIISREYGTYTCFWFRYFSRRRTAFSHWPQLCPMSFGTRNLTRTCKSSTTATTAAPSKAERKLSSSARRSTKTPSKSTLHNTQKVKQ